MNSMYGVLIVIIIILIFLCFCGRFKRSPRFRMSKNALHKEN